MKAAFSLVAASLGTAVAQIHIPLELRQVNSNEILGRDNTQLSLVGNDFLYVTNISVGTPAQNMQVVISQSSGDTWVRDNPYTYFDGCNATAAREYYTKYYDDPEESDYVARKLREVDLQCAWGFFNKSTSTSYAAANYRYTDFTSYLADGTYVSGSNFTDTLKVGGIELTNYAMGLVDNTNRYTGALGLGMNISYSDSYSSSSSSSTGRLYVHFLDRLVKEGKIKSPAYSIWLDNAEGKTGSLLLGAIDTSKYDGTLTRLIGRDSSYSYYSSSFGASQFQVDLVAVNASDSSTKSMAPTNSNDFPFPVTISTGESLSYLPDSIASKIWDKAGATYNRTLRAATIPCNTDKPDTQFTFQLGGEDGPILSASLKNLILSSTVLSTTYAAESGICAFGIQNSTSSGSSSSSYMSNIGSALLRGTYLVFDTANQEVAVAPLKANPGTSNVVAFSDRAAAVPSAVLYCGSSSSRACRNAPSSSATTGPGSRYTSSSGGDYPTYGYGYDSGMPLWEQLAIGISVPFGILTLLGIGIGIVLWRRASAALAKGHTKELDEESVQDTPAMMAGARDPATVSGAPTPTSAPVSQNRSGGMPPVLPPIHEASMHDEAVPVREPSPLSATEETAPQPPPRSPKGKAPEVIPAEATEHADAPLVQEQPHDHHETGTHAR